MRILQNILPKISRTTSPRVSVTHVKLPGIPLLFLLILTSIGSTQAQPLLKTGDPTPDMIIRPIINAPMTALDLRAVSGKFLILNFWGTWCSPCLPEMDSLAKLQKANNNTIQVIAISDEPVGRLKKYLERQPSTLWLASDTSEILYRMFGWRYVGQSAILDPGGHILALVRTDSIDQHLIDRLLRHQPVRSSAETGITKELDSDPFSVDSSLHFQLAWSAYRPEMRSMSRTWLKTPFEGRRRTYFNTCPINIYLDVYSLTPQQVVYEVPEKSICNWEDKSSLCCLDLLVRPEQKDSLLILLGQTLDRLVSFKTRREHRMIPVYVLSRLPGSTALPVSAASQSSFDFSGRGFNGTGIRIKLFADYVSNELKLPVIDETELKEKYDIHTVNTLRTEEDLLAALKKLGLTVTKTTREMDMLVVYR
jgi:peroxiredoxin